MTRILVVACGALVRELRAVLGSLPDGSIDLDVEYLQANLHNRPERIADAVRWAIRSHPGPYDRILIGYADCGTGGGLDAVAEELGALRLPGAHCYELLAGRDRFDELHVAEPGTFYLTDFLARHADALVFGALGLDRHPELRDVYFRNYRRVCYLAQTDDPSLVERARSVADRLGLELTVVPTGLERLGREVEVALVPAGARS